MGMLEMLYYNLYQRLPKSLKKKTKVNNQVLLMDNINTIDTNINLFFEEELFDIEELQLEIEMIDTEMNDDNLVMEKFFDFKAYKQKQEISEESSPIHHQSFTYINEDWSIDDIFKT
ncbi:28160_t:CDS:1 [Dentiscutata erythropus]|uniref:28160_t:CDS:1 n=1 Tax=Dentiscutata erythropus TaxID=1348616 RepID=A0A9N9GE41_9GLOM|nr:28160_t:CDS:1 [Dentiscutata erythropus]